MSRTKYLKFGARADKNLSDLSNKTQALDNILNDLSTQLDDDGNPLSFTSADLLPLVGISETGLAELLTEEGQAADLIELAGSTVQTTTDSSTLIDVEPRITIQDYIDNYKAVLGSPPWIDGGSGPNATFVPSNRLNSNTTDQLNASRTGVQLTAGNRYKITTLGGVTEAEMNAISVTNKGSAPAVGDIFVASQNGSGGNYPALQVRNVTIPIANSSSTANPSALKATELFTTKTDSSLDDIVTSGDFWTDGVFKFSGKLHPSFKNTFGGIQWEGYLTNRFDPEFRIAGAYFIIEEDVNNNNNWTMLKAVTTSEIPTFNNIKWTNDEDGTTKIEFTDQDDYKRVCIDMTITLNNITARVNSLTKTYDPGSSSFKYYANLETNVGNTDTSGSLQTFEYDPLSNELMTGVINITPVKLGQRRHIRFTAYWPELSDGEQYSQKTFEEDREAARTMGSQYFYKTDGVTDSFGRYTFPYFKDNRAHELKQDSNAKLVVKDTISLEYKPDQENKNLIPMMSNTYQVTPKEVSIVDVSGKLQATTLQTYPFADTKVGDWIVVIPTFNAGGWNHVNSKAYSYQILDKKSDDTVFVDPGYIATTGLAIGTAHNIITIKNEGLVGIYTRDAGLLVNTLQATINKLDTGTGSMNRGADLVAKDDLIRYIDFQGGSGTVASHRYPLRLNTIATQNAGSVGLFAGFHPGAPSTGFSTNMGIVAVYASKGLNDLSGAAECEGVYGLEIATQAGNSANRLYVTDTSRGNEMLNDIVYFRGSDPANPIIDESNNGVTAFGSTKVTNVSQGGGYIDINNAINGILPAGTTIVLVPDGYSGEKYLNREYCVIPLNTAPPFGSTDAGLETPGGFPNLMVKTFSFADLAINYNSATTGAVVSLSNNAFTNNVPDKYMTIQHGNTSYKMLINDTESK